jgi:dipeptide/tripeptide permease
MPHLWQSCVKCALIFEVLHLRTFAYYWGITGVILLIGSAVYRLTPRVLELRAYELSAMQLMLLGAFLLFMLYSEGYKGFHLNFAPRVVVRAEGLQKLQAPWLKLLAPLVCMGLLHATRKRQLISWLLTFAIVLLVVGIRYLPQPWRGIIDAGVVAGLMTGILSIVWHWLRFDLHGVKPDTAADMP